MHDLDAYIAQLKAIPELAVLLAPLFELIEWQSRRIDQLEAQVETLQKHVHQLEVRRDQNSTNSHKPPSSDLYKKTKPGLPRKKGRKQGGQPGHEGDTLRMVAEPDHIKLLAPAHCPCGCALDGLEGLERQIVARRQVFDLPEPRLEHWLQVKVRRTLSSAKIAGLQDRRQPEIGSKGQHQTSQGIRSSPGRSVAVLFKASFFHLTGSF